jgi:hypothetical protein
MLWGGSAARVSQEWVELLAIDGVYVYFIRVTR